MGYKHDQRLPSEIHKETMEAALEEAEEPLPAYTPASSSTAQRIPGPPPGPPPPLPPRQSQSQSRDDDHLETLTLAGSDPRATSQESLVPAPSRTDGKRILLLIYIHGFMGNETSFASFPAHVHSLLADHLRPTHAVHTKVYPRYKTRNDIAVVRDQFSQWLEPHEGPNTDVILLGHSMGGIVAAEVALMPSPTQMGYMQHKLLGTLNLDVPFLGMHPGIIGAGLSSLFGNDAAAAEQSAQNNEAVHNSTTADEDVALLPIPTSEPRPDLASVNSSTSHVSSLTTPEGDPYFNPSYTNDLPVPIRKPVDNFFHFVDKHLMKAERKSDLLKAGGKLITSHMQFGGTMAKYTRLDDRYKQLRALEKDPTRVRFVNYFSTCYGRPKPPKAVKESKGKGKAEVEAEAEGSDDETPDINSLTLTSAEPIPDSDLDVGGDTREDVSVDQESTGQTNAVVPVDGAAGSESSDDAFEDASETHEARSEEGKAAELEKRLAALPALPDEPVPPKDFDESAYDDKDAQKLAKQQHAREMRAHNQAVKDRNAAVKEREKLIAKFVKENMKNQDKKSRDEEKAAQKAAKEAEKNKQKAARDEEKAAKKLAREKEEEAKKAEKQRIKEEKQRAQEEKQLFQEKKKQQKEALARQDSAQLSDGDEETGDASSKDKGKKLKTFCLTPPKATRGQRTDWVPVFIDKADQVTAHCGLFNMERPHYEAFVQEVVDLIGEWVEEREGTLMLA